MELGTKLTEMRFLEMKGQKRRENKGGGVKSGREGEKRPSAILKCLPLNMVKVQ